MNDEGFKKIIYFSILIMKSMKKFLIKSKSMNFLKDN